GHPCAGGVIGATQMGVAKRNCPVEGTGYFGRGRDRGRGIRWSSSRSRDTLVTVADTWSRDTLVTVADTVVTVAGYVDHCRWLRWSRSLTTLITVAGYAVAGYVVTAA
ncbi:MAG: hypothetical protein K0U36_00800, partial [Alphaproteobacteria bacterium]|nr:hypothetical protein [Alphaproteobacteria bacterium]